MPVLCARLLIDCSTLSAPCLEPELRLIHRSRAKSRQVRRSSSESGSGLNVHEGLRSHHLERRGGANGDSWPVSGGCIHSLPVRSCGKIRGSKKKCLQKRGEFVPADHISEATRAGGVKAGRDQRPPEGHGLDGAEHAAALGRVGMLGHFYYDLSSDDLWSESAFCSPQ